jgi:hypothetical protein
MKTFGTFVLSILCIASAHADYSCQNQIVLAVQNQVKVDYPGQNLTVVAPNMQGYDGGEVKDLDVIVTQAGNEAAIVTTYEVTIDETCSIEFQGRRPQK